MNISGLQRTPRSFVLPSQQSSPVRLRQGADQVCFAGIRNTSEKPDGFWATLIYKLLAPFRWLRDLWYRLTHTTPTPNPGSPGLVAPDFTLKNHQGKSFQLSQALKKGPVVLFFYPKNNTAFCTKQVKAFRDAYPEFQKLGASVFGISSDTEKSHQQFIANQKLPFALLSDPGGAIRKKYGAQSLGGLIPNRVTFVIDPISHRIQLAYSSQANISQHIESALKALGPKSPLV